MALDLPNVLRFSDALLRASTLTDVVRVAQDAVRSIAGYRTTSVCAFDVGPPVTARPLAIEGPIQQLVWELAPVFPVAGDAMLEEVWAATHPVVVEDARTDPRTDKKQVAIYGNRTMIHVPMRLGDQRIGSLFAGTFHPEEVRPPTPAELEGLVVLAALVGAAFQRVRVQEEQERLRRQVAATQRLESLALLAGGVAHDFNSLLSVVLSSSALLLEGSLTAAQREEVLAIDEAARRAKALTSQLLTLGRRQALHPMPVDLADQLSRLEVLLRRMLPPSIELRVDVPPALPRALVDPNQLDQVLVNLCANARDAMPAGGPLTVRAASPATPEDLRARCPRLAERCVRLSIIDRGEGMTPEVQERIFEPFFTTKAAGVGTGLGLSVAAAIVARHGGHLACASAVGTGTTFDVWLPAA